MGKDRQLRPDTRFNLLFTLIPVAGILVMLGVLCLLRACEGR